MTENNETTLNGIQMLVLTKELRKRLGIKLNPYIRPTPKISRNSKCPCGSGLKYKKCCLELDKLGSNETNREDL